MSLSEQFKKLKENWLLIGILLIVLFFTSCNPIMPITQLGSSFASSLGQKMGYPEVAYDSGGIFGRTIAPNANGDFAPGVDERIITKTASITTEVEKGLFQEATEKVKAILKTSDALLLNENTNKYDSERREYYEASYEIKVETKKYDAVVVQLKEVGEITYFNENMLDVTGTHKNLKIDLETEKERLKRYKEMLEQTINVAEKIDLSDRIFDQERRIKYIEESLTNIDQQVDYSAVYLTVREEQSDYAYTEFVDFAELVQNFVNSINSILRWIVLLIPWAIAVWIIRAIALRGRKRR